MHYCNKCNCGHTDHLVPGVGLPAQPVRIADEQAYAIDQARRTHIAKITRTEVLPATPNLEMYTQLLPFPPGVHSLEVRDIAFSFGSSSAVHRARVSVLLGAHFGQKVDVEHLEHNTWRFKIGALVQMPYAKFDSIHTMAQKMSHGFVSDMRAEGICEAGLFIYIKADGHAPQFLLCGDLKDPKAWAGD